jgi:hypothetical protein
MTRKRAERLYDVTVGTPFYKTLTIRAANKAEAANRAVSSGYDDYCEVVVTHLTPGDERVTRVIRTSVKEEQ